MASLLGKVRTLALGSAHDLLDKMIDLNSPTMLRQYVRDLETAEGNLKSEAAIAAGGIRTLNREVGDLQHGILDKTNGTKTILAGNAPNKDVIARSYATTIIALQGQLKDKQQELTDQQTTSAQLDAALAKLDAKHTEMVSAVRRLESKDRATKAKEHAAGALQEIAAVSASGSGISIDNIEAKMNARADVADEKFDRAMNDPSMQEDPSKSADIDALLASLK